MIPPDLVGIAKDILGVQKEINAIYNARFDAVTMASAFGNANTIFQPCVACQGMVDTGTLGDGGVLDAVRIHNTGGPVWYHQGCWLRHVTTMKPKTTTKSFKCPFCGKTGSALSIADTLWDGKQHWHRDCYYDFQKQMLANHYQQPPQKGAQTATGVAAMWQEAKVRAGQQTKWVGTWGTNGDPSDGDWHDAEYCYLTSQFLRDASPDWLFKFNLLCEGAGIKLLPNLTDNTMILIDDLVKRTSI